ncbi:uncharacterized protein LOC115964228 [Quercus lobata]|uniref:uncharacterized protein LOC115964228 n=1 Tax=Quercus lobata TaxID=97700 RepID=UPI001247996D|nr:uncharacterized protein LOC115964228 [Quercus lobata]
MIINALNSSAKVFMHLLVFELLKDFLSIFVRLVQLELCEVDLLHCLSQLIHPFPYNLLQRHDDDLCLECKRKERRKGRNSGSVLDNTRVIAVQFIYNAVQFIYRSKSLQRLFLLSASLFDFPNSPFLSFISLRTTETPTSYNPTALSPFSFLFLFFSLIFPNSPFLSLLENTGAGRKGLIYATNQDLSRQTFNEEEAVHSITQDYYSIKTKIIKQKPLPGETHSISSSPLEPPRRRSELALTHPTSSFSIKAVKMVDDEVQGFHDSDIDEQRCYWIYVSYDL